MWLGLAGCSRDNPWFVLKDSGPELTSSSGVSEGSSAGTTAAPGTSGTGSGASSGDPPPDSSSSGEPGGSTTTTTSASTTGADDTSTGDTGASSSTGDVEEEALLYDLYQLCPAAVWSDDVDKILCKGVLGVPPAVAQTTALYEAKEIAAIAVFPEQVPAGYIDGVYAVQLVGVKNPRFRAVLVFPPGAKDTDKIVGQVYIESPNVPVVYQSPPIVVEASGAQVLDLDLSAAAQVEGSLSLHLQLTVSGILGLKTRGLWLRPRVVAVP